MSEKLLKLANFASSWDEEYKDHGKAMSIFLAYVIVVVS